MYQTIKVEKMDGIAKITLNRPQRLNAITLELLDELRRALNELEFDDDVRVVIITGEGRLFQRDSTYKRSVRGIFLSHQSRCSSPQRVRRYSQL